MSRPPRSPISAVRIGALAFEDNRRFKADDLQHAEHGGDDADEEDRYRRHASCGRTGVIAVVENVSFAADGAVIRRLTFVVPLPIT